MRKTLVFVVLLTFSAWAMARTLDLKLSSISDTGSSTAWMDHRAFGGSESTLSSNNKSQYYQPITASADPFSINRSGGRATSTQQIAQPASATTCPPNAGGTGAFHVAGGQIIGPNGLSFIARGFNLYDFEMSDAEKSLTGTFPGLNFIRINIHSYDNPSTYQSFVKRMTAQGIVVEFEDHPNAGGAQGSIYTGSELAAETSWYASMAAAYKNNPYVWFGTFNEPPTTGGSLSQWQRTTYSAIRGAGNNNPILLQVSGSKPKNLNAALDPSVYASMTNVIWDVHIYGYQSDYSTDQATVDANVQAMFVAARRIKSADGTMPILIGEYGPSTDGTSDDPNGTQVVTAVVNLGSSNKFGSAAWAWNPGGKADHLLDKNGNPSYRFGQQVQSYISTHVVPPADCQMTKPGAAGDGHDPGREQPRRN